MKISAYMAPLKPSIQRHRYYALTSLRWLLLASVTGIAVGAFSSVFSWCMTAVTNLRMNNDWLIFLLPAGGLIIVFLYQAAKMKDDKGTNQIISAIHFSPHIPVRLAPLIFISTVLTHLFGGSAGREGAALQLGGSIGNGLGNLFRLDDSDKKIMVLCGMSAAFAALFGTPIAAAVFPLEVVSVGIMQYSALLPCIFSSLIASQFAANMGIAPEAFTIVNIPDLNFFPVVKIILVAACCGIASTIFCFTLDFTHKKYAKLFQNPYLRIFTAGMLIIVITLLLGTRDYNGAGIPVIEQAMEGEVVWYAFIIKIVLTALTLGAGFKGGEIIPSLFIGAALGCLLGQLLGLSPSLCAAAGMVSLFCGATNCPLSSMLIGFELFGFQGVYYILIAIAVSYVFSGYRSLYAQQIIVYSKYKVEEHS